MTARALGPRWRDGVDAATRWLLGAGCGERLELFRTLLTWSLLFYSLHRWQFAREWLTAAGFHPAAGETLGQLPLPLLPASWLWSFAIVYFGSIVTLLVQTRSRALTRAALWVVLACVFYVSAVDRLAMFTINKLYIAIYAILAIAPLPTRSRPEDPRSRLELRSRWPLRVLQATLIIQLFGAGVCKLLGEVWMQRSDVLWFQVQNVFMTDAAAWLIRVLPMEAWSALQHLALAYELAAPALFLVPRLRPAAYLLGIGMFGMISLTMQHLVYFALQLLCFFVLFVDAGRLARARRWLADKLA